MSQRRRVVGAGIGIIASDCLLLCAFRGAESASQLTRVARAISESTRASLHLDHVISDLQTFLRDIEVAAAPVNKLITLRQADGSALTPKSGAGALLVHLGPVMKEIDDARSSVTALLDAFGISQVQTDLARASRGQDRVGEDGDAGMRSGSD